MVTQYVNKATLNGTSTVYWVTSGTPDSTGAQSGYNPANLTNIAVDYTTNVGTTTTGGQTLSTTSWVTALDLDFTQQASQTFTSDGSYTISGLTWTKINSTNESSSAAIINGTGLKWTPGPNGDIYAASYSAPGLQIPLSSIIPNFDLSMPIRCWIYISSDNAGGNFDNVYMAFANSNNFNMNIKRGYNSFTGPSALNIFTNGNSNSSNIYQLTPSTGYYSSNVMVMEAPEGISAGRQLSYAGNYSSNWPNLSSLTPLNAGLFSLQIDSHFANTPSNMNFVLGAHKAGGGSAVNYQPVIARIKIEYMAQQPTNFSNVVVSDISSNLPAAGVPGKIFLPTDNAVIFRDNGTSWKSFGPVFPLTTPPASTSLTWVNQGSCTTTDYNGGFTLVTDAAPGNNRHLLVTSAPAAPYTFTVGMFLQLWPAPNPTIGGLVFRESSTGKFVEFITYFSGNTLHMATFKWNNATSFSAAYDDGQVQPAISTSGFLFLRIQDDGLNLHFFWSSDGVNFMEWISSRSRTDFMTSGPNQIGIVAQSQDTNPLRVVKMNVLHWKVG